MVNTLELNLTLNNQLVRVLVNEQESHEFPFSDIYQTTNGIDDFFENPRPYGEKLFNALFKNKALSYLNALYQQTERTIVLVLESSELDKITWEYLYNKGKDEYVVESCAFMRALPEKQRPVGGKLASKYNRIPLLFTAPNPLLDPIGKPLDPLNVDGEWKEITNRIMTSKAAFDLHQLRPATLEVLHTYMADFRGGIIFHFSGHSAVEGDNAILLFEEENGAGKEITAPELIQYVKDNAILCFLSSCQSANHGKTGFSNLTRRLVESGVPFALGMQFELPDKYDDIISKQFYNYLARGYTVPQATMHARRALKREAIRTEDEQFIGMIALYVAHPNEMGHLALDEGTPRIISPQFRPADVSILPSPPNGLLGRQRELMRIGTKLVKEGEHSTITLHGTGGIGKTALLRQALLRFASSFDITISIGLEPLPSLEKILERIERYLGLKSPCSSDMHNRKNTICEALTSKHTLLGLDNFETLNYALGENDNEKQKTAKSLHAFFELLGKGGVKLCVTSREITNLPDEFIVDIQGLASEDGGRLFQENVVDPLQKEHIYIEETHEISKLVDGHPLALRLLASVYNDLIGISLEQYIKDLNAFLPKARDKWTEEDRHESLRASFQFTMNNLLKSEKGKDLQIALSQASVFSTNFFDQLIAPIWENHFTNSEDELQKTLPKTNGMLLVLWERSLLERIGIPTKSGDFFIYHVHPALRTFAFEQLDNVSDIIDSYWRSIRNFARLAENEYTNNSLMSAILSYSLDDLKIASQIKNDRDGAILRLRTSKIMHHFCRFNEALELVNEGIDIIDNINDIQGKSAAYLLKGQIYRSLSDNDQAIKFFMSSFENSKKIGDDAGCAMSLTELAEIYSLHGNVDKAKELLLESQEIFKSIDDKKSWSLANIQLANIYKTQGKVEEALKLQSENQATFIGLGAKREEGLALSEQAQIFLAQGKVKPALELFQKALEIAESLNDLEGKCALLYSKAYALKMIGDFDSAFALFKESLQIARKIGDREGEATALEEIAYILRKRNDLDSAVELYQEALQIFSELRHIQGKSAVLNGLAYIFQVRGDLETATKLNNELLTIMKSLGDLRGQSGILNEMGNIELSKGNLDEAITLYQRSLDIKDSIGDILGKAISLYMCGQAFWVKQEYERGLYMMLEGLSSLSENQLEPQTQQEIMETIRNAMVSIPRREIDVIWKNVTGQPLPGWMS